MFDKGGTVKKFFFIILFILIIASPFFLCKKNSVGTKNVTDISNPIRGRWSGPCNIKVSGVIIERTFDFNFTEDFKYHVTCTASIGDSLVSEYSFTESGIYVLGGSNREGRDLKLVTEDNTVRNGSYQMGRVQLYLDILGWGEMNLNKYEG